MNRQGRAETALWISSAPLRISLAGGGTDVPSYADRFGGVVLGTTTDLRVTVVGRAGGASPVLRACLDTCATAPSAEALPNPFARAALDRHWTGDPLQLTSFSAVAGGTGLGSSAAFCAALIGGLTAARGGRHGGLRGMELAEAAAGIETDALNRPVGKQDQYLSVLGGFHELRFGTDGTVEAEHLDVQPSVVRRLDEELLMFFTGVTRDAGAVLAAQGNRVGARDRETEARLHEMKELTAVVRKALEGGDLCRLGEAMGRHWELKQGLSSKVTLPGVDRAYREALAAGATGGKLLGAGGGGFLLLHVPARAQSEVRGVVAAHGMTEQPFGLDDRGHEVHLLEGTAGR
ncbi:GHMP family kinase ATP-binding protein [Streptomyces avermitilis]|uniref:GHMP family kinase ATP-binding protein n=1 Tax=Streptomyces avermitilis TaxID=33903 RepID=UPI0033A6834A